MTLENATPHMAIAVPMLDAVGREVVVTVVKATFSVTAGGDVVPNDEPHPIRPGETLYDVDDPLSSLRYPSDLCIEKVGTDVIVVGAAVSRTMVRVMDVGIRVRDYTVPIRVHGERLFCRGIAGVGIGPAVPFDRMPIVYERAYGGVVEDWSLVEPRNWSGVGLAKRDADLVERRAPQIEHPARPHTGARDRHPPIGCGAIMSHWSPRRERAGTFDDAWKAERMPLPPHDYDARCNNVAHPSLSFDKSLRTGDSFGVVGMSLEPLAFQLPAFHVVIRARYSRSGTRSFTPPIDTILVEPERRTIEISMRAAVPLGRGSDVLRALTADRE